jgi:DNA-binding NarL/FixJ family response regulator
VTETEPIRLLIADDNADFRAGLRGLLTAQPGFEVVGEATNGLEVLGLAAQVIPDVVLMDLQMPLMNGIEATRTLVGARPHIGVLMLTMFEDDDSVFAAMRAGARGYLLKGARKAETVRAVIAVANGEAIFSPAVARRMMGFFLAARPAATVFPELTDRERDILGRIAHGKGNAEIADELVLSLKTVRNHVSNVLAKLQVADRAQAALRAREAGLG